MSHYQAKAKRLNVFLSNQDFESLRQIAKSEDRASGYAASWFISWVIRQYVRAGESFKSLSEMREEIEHQIEERIRQRAADRAEAHRQNGRSSSPRKARGIKEDAA